MLFKLIGIEHFCIFLKTKYDTLVTSFENEIISL